MNYPGEKIIVPACLLVKSMWETRVSVNMSTGNLARNLRFVDELQHGFCTLLKQRGTVTTATSHRLMTSANQMTP